MGTFGREIKDAGAGRRGRGRGDTGIGAGLMQERGYWRRWVVERHGSRSPPQEEALALYLLSLSLCRNDCEKSISAA